MEINNLKKLNLTSSDNNIDEVDFVERQPDTEGPEQLTQQPTEVDMEEEFENHKGDDNEAEVEDIYEVTLTTDFKLKEMPQHGQNQNPFQKSFIESLKNKITDKDSVTMNLLKNDANHTFHHIPSSNPPNAKERCVKGVQIHAPHIHSVCPCPCCGWARNQKGSWQASL